MAVIDWSSTAALNINVNGVNIAEGCQPANLNNALRYIMAGVHDFYLTTFRTSGADKNFYILADGDPDPGAPNDGDIVINYTP